MKRHINFILQSDSEKTKIENYLTGTDFHIFSIFRSTFEITVQTVIASEKTTTPFCSNLIDAAVPILIVFFELDFSVLDSMVNLVKIKCYFRLTAQRQTGLSHSLQPSMQSVWQGQLSMQQISFLLPWFTQAFQRTIQNIN